MKLLLQIFQAIEKFEFHASMRKILFKQSNSLISVIRTLLRRKQRLRGDMLTLYGFVQTQMMLNVQVTQIQQLYLKTPKTPQGRTINSKYHSVIGAFEGRNHQKRPQMKKKKYSFTKSIATMVKLPELNFKSLLHSPYFLDLAPSDYWLFANSKRMLQGKKFDSNEEVISENEAYFVVQNKSFDKKGIELLEKRWNQNITRVGDNVDE